MRLNPRERLAIAGALIWSFGVLVAATTLPVYQSDSASAGTPGAATSGATLVEVNGSGVLAVTAAPLLATVAVGTLLLVRRRHGHATIAAWAVITLLAGLAVVSLLTVGSWMLPVVAALAAAADAPYRQAEGPAVVPTA